MKKLFSFWGKKTREITCNEEVGILDIRNNYISILYSKRDGIIMKNNAYEIMKEMWAIDEEIQKLTSDLKKTAQITEREVLERRIDSLYAEFLKYKHLLQDIQVTGL